MGTCYADQRAMKMAAVLSSDPGSRALLGPLQWKTLPNSGCTGLLLAHIRASLDHIPRLPLGLEFCALRASLPSPPPDCTADVRRLWGANTELLAMLMYGAQTGVSTVVHSELCMV